MTDNNVEVVNDKIDTSEQLVKVCYVPLSSPSADDINLVDYWQAIVNGRWLLFFFTVSFTFIAILISLLMTPIFKADVLMVAVSDEANNAGSSKIVSQLGGLASLAGIGVGVGGSKDEAVAKLMSREFTERFIKENNIIPLLFEDMWDPENNQWLSDDDEDIPTVWDAIQAFGGVRSISEDRNTGLLTLSIKWKDPELAAQWANQMVSSINRVLRDDAIVQAEKSIVYLDSELNKTSVVELQQAIYRLKETHINKIMLANVREEYAFKVLDSAMVPEEKYKPNRKLIAGIGLVLGGMVGLLVCMLTPSLARGKKKILSE